MPTDFGSEVMSAEGLLRHIGANIYWEPLSSPVPAPLHYGPFPLSDPPTAQEHSLYHYAIGGDRSIVKYIIDICVFAVIARTLF